ncbi:pectate lyase [Mesorhizobium sp. M00.F.Ca.ET.216.01.1.1]|uniref:pectate lyase n=1 Tax=Mesorhizobium sp. M00.F.Ca.ET.216.01.1.1 TaxID=2500528 RepID=UPI001FE18BAE|nr:pectate lyase [Mesorhizobium sp. M00.F.Ca.ET.216.01.1.1]
MIGSGDLHFLRYLAAGAGLALFGMMTFYALDLLSFGQLPGPGLWDSSLTSSSRLLHALPKLPDGRQRAFPTAEGFGAAAKGGRGGQVFFVTNTAESGAGSLRACIDAAGPRNCVFRLSGTITLDKTSLVVSNPYLTIAGETAPGEGIAIRNGPLQTRPSLEIITHDVIVRHIRLRPGPHEVATCCSGALGLYGKDATNIIIDHVSASWGSDETVDSEDASYFTFQWGFVTEPLLDGGPGKHNRARNMLLTKGGNISVHHNLFALGKFRSPQFQMSGPGAVADVVNNVLYSPIWGYVISFSDRWAAVRANVVANYKIDGEKEKEMDDHLVHLFAEGGKGFSIFLAENVDEPYRPDTAAAEDQVIEENMRDFTASQPFAVASVRTTSAPQAYEDVLVGAGATRPARDAVDLRMVDAVRTRSGALLETNPGTVGGWPSLASSLPPLDVDRDGMADAWERSVGLSPTNPSDGASDLDGDGWTNFEEYLHELAGDGAGMRGTKTSVGSAS